MIIRILLSDGSRQEIAFANLLVDLLCDLRVVGKFFMNCQLLQVCLQTIVWSYCTVHVEHVNKKVSAKAAAVAVIAIAAATAK